jgi:hypothetical protein
MTNLLERCRTAGPDEAGALLRECYRAIFPPRNTLPQGSDERDAAYWRDENFNALVSINTEPAFIGAALMLVPDGDEYDMSTIYGCARAGINLNHGQDDGPHYGSNECGCLSLAILSAVLSAQAPQPVSVSDIGEDEEVGR